MRRVSFLPAILAVLALACPALASGDLSLTVSSGGRTLVREVRSVEPAKGRGSVTVSGLPLAVEPSSIQARFSGSGAPAIELLRFEADPFQARTLLRRLVGREVEALAAFGARPCFSPPIRPFPCWWTAGFSSPHPNS